jgi:hypothetical protein
MARPVGSPTIVGVAKLHVPESFVYKQGRRRYVFAEVVLSKIHSLSVQQDGTRRLYLRFHASLRRELYNQVTLYGLRAIDADNPQKPEVAVSVRLEIIIGEGKDSYKQSSAS